VALLLCLTSTTYADDRSFADAQAMLAEGNSEGAQEVLVELVAIESTEAEAFLYLGTMLRTQGDLDAARQTFENGILRDGQHIGLLCEYAMTLAWMEERQEALAAYDRALVMDDTALCAQRGQAIVLFWSGDHRRATAAYERLVSQDPADLDALRGLADVHRSRMRTQQARRLYNEVLERSPGDERAAEGLRHLDDLRRWEVYGVLGAVHFEGATTIFSGRAGGAVSLTPDTSIRAQYEADVPSNGAAGGGGNFVSLAHTMTVSVSQKATSWLTLELGYAIRRQKPATLHRLTLRASAPIVDALRVLVGVRPSIDHSAQTGLLGDVGVQLVLHSRVWVMGQFYVFTASAEQDSWSSVGTVSLGLSDALELRIIGSVGRRGTLVSAAGAANFEWRISETWKAHVGYSIQRGEARRHRAEVGVRVSL
jgi:tetratricopeptide (TPR) repeat protein